MPSSEADAPTCKHCGLNLGGVSGEGFLYYVHTEGSQHGLRTCAITPYGFNAEPIGAECERICNGSWGIEPRPPALASADGRHPAVCYEDGCVCDLHGPAAIPRPIPPAEKGQDDDA